VRAIWTVCFRGLAAAAFIATSAAAQDNLDTPTDRPAAVLGAGAPSLASSQRNSMQTQIIAFDRDKVFQNSEAGRVLDAKIQTLRDDLVAENDRIYADLEAEEKSLLTLKGSLSSEAFRLKADAFDTKVTAIRAEQKLKSETVQQAYDQGARTFEQSLNVVLTEIAREVGAVAVFERKQIYLMSGSIDISAEAIRRLDVQTNLDTDAETNPPASEADEP
jgi:Skp family chaperone for outer membrane proteins